MTEPHPPPRTPDPADVHPGRARASAAFLRLVDIMARLRAPDGCPWDREQTLQTLAPYVMEEAAEVVDAIERGHPDDVREEVGDLLFEGVFLSQVASEDGTFDVADALHTVNEKLVRRHPHVFAREAALSPADVTRQWDAIKRDEKAARGEVPRGVLEGVPAALPALMRASTLCRKAASVGFDWPGVDGILDKMDEEVRELRHAITEGTPEEAAEELGDLLFVLANLGRRLGVDPEATLRAANRKFERRFMAMQQQVEAGGRTLAEATLDEMEAGWQAVKRAEPSSDR
jgi:MazG family protein